MSSFCVTLSKSDRLKSASKLLAKTLVSNGPLTKIKSSSSLKSKISIETDINAKSKSESKLSIARPIVSHGPSISGKAGEFNIRGKISLDGALRARANGISVANVTYTDKFGGSFDRLKNQYNFLANEKLYPASDIEVSLNGSTFVNHENNTTNLYDSINEGVFTGNYIQYGKTSTLISDELHSYIHPSSILTNGDFRYKCQVNTPTKTARESFLFIRASAPLFGLGIGVSPQYKIHNIKLEDPSGNLIIKYKDIILRGDADYTKQYVNFATYITEPEVNNLLLNTWEPDYPLMDLPSGYTLNLDFAIQCLDDPFNTGFDKGYEDTCNSNFLGIEADNDDYLAVDGSPMSTQTQNYSLNPNNSIRISAIEICNSGEGAIVRDQYLNFYSEVSPIGQRVTKSIFPSQVLTSDFDTGIYPTVKSVWKSSPDILDNFDYNITEDGAKVLTGKLQDDASYNYIVLDSTDPILDSGKLQLKFSHRAPERPVTGLLNGEFDLAFNNSLSRANAQVYPFDDNFFVVDSVELKIKARKAIGSRDYVLDIVGYSDDKILNVTPSVGGFLQNLDGSGDVPSTSGFIGSNELALSAESISEKEEYFTSPTTQIGDHYKLSSLPVVNSTSFQEYTIPLKIYEENVLLGQGKTFTESSYFENLYLDIYPLPSGASFANIELVVKYKPSNGLMLHTLAQAAKDLARRTIKIYPSPRQINDKIINSDNAIITNIPHGYKTTSDLQSNYARRWRGVVGDIVAGPYDPYEFDFSFYNPQANHPFLNGFYSFSKDSGNYIISDALLEGFNAISGTLVGNYNKISNIGLRFNSESLFDDPTDYKTTNWTSISGYENHELYNKITDSFNNAIRISGSLCNINFGDINTSNGFAVYTKFTPDITVSGASYNLFNSGVIFAKWDDGNDLEFALGYNDGYLCGYARDNLNNIITVQDTVPYSDYHYPIPVLLTYVNNQLYLYADNELAGSDFNILRASSNTFTIADGSSDLVLGYCGGSGVGMNMFVAECGISTSGNILSSSPNRRLKQTTAESFFNGIRMKFWNNTESYSDDRFKLWDYVNEDTGLWKIGDFKICAFSPDFDSFTKRVGEDFIIHTLHHDGSEYSQTTDILLPSSIITSGISYHTQIENDFLRFNLSDIPSNSGTFYSAYPRISKNLPKGYNFQERAFVVDTILEHSTNDNIVWPDNTLGPKLIVSLYTSNKDPDYLPNANNWGLINRYIHKLEPSGCWQKLSTVFDYNSLVDISEPWASFDLNTVRSEFDQKYISKDINDMFLQYDLVYPSGSPFNSTIKIHSAHVRLEDALFSATDNNSSFNLVSSGEKVCRYSLNLYNNGKSFSQDNFNLLASGGLIPEASSIFNLYTSGAYFANSSMPLYTFNFGSGELSIPLYVSGRNNKFAENISPLVLYNTEPYPSYNSSLGLTTYNKVSPSNNNLRLFTRSINPRTSLFPNSAMSLYIDSPLIMSSASGAMNLFMLGDDFTKTSINNSLRLTTINYPAINNQTNKQITITWDSTNTGSSITTDDNIYAALAANDEIRGVELLCYGTCEGENPCSESSFELHGQAWSPDPICVDGGIFRAKDTYTNLATSGFNTNIGYSGHFYDIRKYTGLISNAPYNIIVTSETGSTDRIELPKLFEEVEYGTNDYVQYSGSKFTSVNPEADEQRLSDIKYGYSVAAKNDLFAVGAPFYTLYDSGNYQLDEAGAVFLYRRLPAPSGYNWPIGADKSAFVLEEKVTLPENYLRDYYTERPRTIVAGFPDIQERVWSVGQYGRQFGHSVDIAVNPSGSSFQENGREVLVVGAPSAKWERTFEDLDPSGVQIGLMIFTDEFVPVISIDERTKIDYRNILANIQNKDILFKYFADPSIKFNVNLIILEPTLDSINRTSQEFPEPKPSFITKKKINRNKGLVNEVQTEKILSGIKEAFHEAFPYDPSKINNNIPPLLGIYVDNSRSLGRNAVSPALDRFISYYQNYSFASGVRDFYGSVASGQVYEYIPDFGKAENWIEMSNDVFNELLDTGRLVRDDDVKYITSGVGVQFFNSNLAEFNVPPYSGGAVYIFEKESGSWTLTQEINSPNSAYDVPDRFGHAVGISNDGEVIAIGSPYINEACKVYEYKPEEKTRLYNGLPSWISFKSSATGGIGRYFTLLNSYNNWSTLYGQAYAKEILYSKLTPSEKFEVRKYLNIQEYQSIYTYSYTDISYASDDWRFIAEAFAPTSRLGYSVAVNEDGSIVAFGAPTDSMNISEDMRVYYKNEGYIHPTNFDNLNTGEIIPSWRSNVNAGAVRVFESRKYYPHNSVVEFGKFGNLHETINKNVPSESGKFNYLSQIFSDINFRKTAFSEVDIPQDAGLAFIITPEVDALSDEVMDNISNWLALGDRNLVLVGNDPTWEDDGAYAESNEIINEILSRLSSRIRLFPARNKYEAMVSGCSVAIPSFIPDNITSTYISRQQTNIYGTADIRMYLAEDPIFGPSYKMEMPCSPPKDDRLDFESIDNPDNAPPLQLNNKCELPLTHKGDLRAQWLTWCRTCNDGIYVYAVNWPLIFKTFQPFACCSYVDDGINNLPNQEPIPLMVAADTVTDVVVIPATEASSGVRPIYEQSFKDIVYFDEDKLASEPVFVWNSGLSQYSALSTNINSEDFSSDGLFYKPEMFEDRQSLLQARAIPQQEIIKGSRIVSPVSHYCLEEYVYDSSRIVFIAGVFSESEKVLYSGTGDSNLNFYANLVSKNKTGGSVIAQLGGWTGRSDFTEAFSGSIIQEIFENTGNEVVTNITKLYSTHDVCWIANPINLPSAENIADIQRWLSLGNKKLIITYDETLTQTLLIKQLSDLLGSKIKPLYLTTDDRYALTEVAGTDNGSLNIDINSNHPIYKGFDVFSSIQSIDLYLVPYKFTPLRLVSGVNPVASAARPVLDTKYDTVGYWKMETGIAKVTFPAIAGSGYKIFVSTISETPAENQPITMHIDNISQGPDIPYPKPITFSVDLDTNGDSYSLKNLGVDAKFSEASNNKVINYSYNVQVQEGKDDINIYFYNYNKRLDVITDEYTPKTTRILSISGVPIGISKGKTADKNIFVGWEYFRASEPQPEQIITTQRFAAISSESRPYCQPQCSGSPLGLQKVEDGPMVAAQEVEHFSSFDTGVARSRVTVLADASMVQGSCVVDENGVIKSTTYNFLRSLYPFTNFPNANAGRQYVRMSKIVSPERGSPQKYLSASNNTKLSSLFGGSGSIIDLSSFSDKESKYDPRYVRNKKAPWPPLASVEQIELVKKAQIEIFANNQLSNGGTARFSGIIEGEMYTDAGIYGGMPQIMRNLGYDYLDHTRFPSGYPGDLFGYSIDLNNEKLIIGSPFGAFSQENIQPWSYYMNGGVPSGLIISNNGGAGSVYIFERTFNGSGLNGQTVPWEFTRKLRPYTINAGQDLTDTSVSQSGFYLGNNNYTSTELTNFTIGTDRFGHDVSIDGDIIAVGAPGHDFGNHVENGTGEFIRKSFNSEFNIPSRKVIDLGSSGIRYEVGSGVSVLNNGAVFVYENTINDWVNKAKDWKYKEKIVPNGYITRQQSYNENDNFGHSVSIDRNNRTDSDYIISVGSPRHQFGASGVDALSDAGAAYSYDIMLRRQSPAKPSPNSWINARVFGETDLSQYPSVYINTINNGENSQKYYASGIVYSNIDGEIFLEASGQDLSDRRFITHRPYIRSVEGLYIYGTESFGGLRLYNFGTVDTKSNMNLFTSVANSSFVYNTLGLYATSVQGFASGVPSGLFLYTDCPDPTSVFDSLPINISGIGINTDTLNMRIRGN